MKAAIESPFVIKQIGGFTPHVGQLVSMMHCVRFATLDEISGLTVNQLDHLLDADANSIGMLLEHIACVEEWYQENTLGIAFDDEQLATRELGGGLGEQARNAIRGRELAQYVNRLASVRKRTLDELASRNDEWLFEEGPWGGARANNYFKWFHVLEDEISHRGQIRMIRKRLPRL